MGTVLFTWELGSGLGHIGPMKVIAGHLKRRGHDCVFAVKDVVAARGHLGAYGPILQAPACPTSKILDQPFGAANFADILAGYGFADRLQLEALVAAWSDLFDLVQPGLLVADFSPLAQIAAHGTIAIVVVGYGFCLPPHDLPSFPSFREDLPQAASERPILANVNAVIERRGGQASNSLPALFRGDHAHCYSLPFFDPYAEYRRPPAAGPIEPMPDLTPPPHEGRIFAYLDGDLPNAPELVLGLSELRLPVEIYIRGGNRVVAEFATRRGLGLHAEPPSWVDLMPRVSAVLSHAGAGIAHAAALAGRPQILIPLYREQGITTAKLRKSGAGVQIEPSKPLADAVGEALLDHASAAAQRLASDLRQSYHPAARLEQLLNMCHDSLAHRAVLPPGVQDPTRVTSMP
jgi:UDP:flavonoid glycosyltransferase YjiC (YdhE family)